MADLAKVLVEQGKLTEAIELQQQAADTCAAAHGDNDELTIEIRASLAVMLAESGRERPCPNDAN